MNKLLLSFAGLLFSSSISFALPANHDYFGELLTLWNNSSTLPAKAEFDGWFSGRCYRADNPQVPFGAIAVAMNRTIEIGNPNNGPLFPPETKQIHGYNLFGSGFQGTGAPADFFDELSPRKESWVCNMINQTRFFESQETSQGLEGFYPQGNIRYATKTMVQNNQTYYISKITFDQSRYPVLAGQIFGMCYFFKKVK